jgi:histidyl-tRNA synthetase
MHDILPSDMHLCILPSDMHLWHQLEKTVRTVFSSYGFSEIRIPVVEKTELFARAIGEATDVVEKEMYSFEDRNGDFLSLRPEGTAGVVRAAIRPQKGRTRQFHQVGAEVFGAAGPDIDAELLVMCQRIWRGLGLSGLRLEINSLGTADERSQYRKELHGFLSANSQELDADSLRRLDRNPLRILDSKNPEVQNLLKDAPSLYDYLGDESNQHFSACRSLLEAFGVNYTVNPRLVRGLDYYSHTVFEWITDQLGAQGTVCAGGRYDGLVEIQGGRPWPGVGFAMGQERLVELMRNQAEPEPEVPHVYLVLAGAGSVENGLKLAEQLREHVPGIRAQSNLGGGSFKSQFKRADRSGARLAIVLGEDELRLGQATIKHLRDDTSQEQVALDQLSTWFRQWLGQETGSKDPGA